MAKKPAAKKAAKKVAARGRQSAAKPSKPEGEELFERLQHFSPQGSPHTVCCNHCSDDAENPNPADDQAVFAARVFPYMKPEHASETLDLFGLALRYMRSLGIADPEDSWALGKLFCEMVAVGYLGRLSVDEHDILTNLRTKKQRLTGNRKSNAKQAARSQQRVAKAKEMYLRGGLTYREIAEFFRQNENMPTCSADTVRRWVNKQ